MTMHFDRIDRAILSALQRDGRKSNVLLAEDVHLSESACLRRVRQLEDAGVIAHYVMLVDQRRVGYPTDVFVQISLHRQQGEDLARFEAAVKEVPEIMECYLMTGDSDYLLRVVVSDMAALERFILEQLSPIPGVEKIRTSFALKQVRYKTALPMPQQS